MSAGWPDVGGAEQAAAQAQASAAAMRRRSRGRAPGGDRRQPVAAGDAGGENFLGINMPAIAATEAQYAEMSRTPSPNHLRGCLDGCRGHSAADSGGADHHPPPRPPNPSQLLKQPPPRRRRRLELGSRGLLGLLRGGRSSIGTVINRVACTCAEPPNAADGFSASVDLNGAQEVRFTAAWFVGNTIPTPIALGHTLAAAAPAAVSGVSSVTPLAGGAAIGEGTLVNSVMGSGASAALGESTALGGLSVPASWSSAAPATLASSTAPLEGSGWTAATDEAAAGGPVTGMMPGMAAAGKGAGAFAGPRYGFKPIVMPKQVVV